MPVSGGYFIFKPLRHYLNPVELRNLNATLLQNLLCVVNMLTVRIPAQTTSVDD